MNKRELRSLLILLVVAVIWGLAFVVQRIGADALDAFSFNGLRFLMGAGVLLPVMLRSEKKQQSTKESNGKAAGYGALIGAVLFIASFLQQICLPISGAGKAGFVTSLYVVLVPVIGIFLGHRTGFKTWISLLLALPALYLLCCTPGEAFSLQSTDILLLISAIFWSAHILITGHAVQKAPAMRLCVMQFLTAGVLNMICALIFENLTWEAVRAAALPLIYMGVGSTAIAYTLQAIGQKDAKPTHAALILASEAVFSAIGGALILAERMGVAGYIGCALMLAAVVLSQMAGMESTKESAHV